MQNFEDTLALVRDYVWSWPLLLLLLGTGAYLTILLKGVQFRYLTYAFKQIYADQQRNSEGDINPYEALMTSLAGAIGTGSIVGVSTAVVVGGLGAIFWMWVTAFLGMATKYAESLLAVKYRDQDANGEMIGGPMEYIEKGLGWKWMAMVFALFGAIAAIGTGNLVQVNAIADSISHVWNVDPWITGIVLAFITAAVVMGGVKSIGQVAGVLVPFMALFYALGGLWIILVNWDQVPGAFLKIIEHAFNPQAALGGIAGVTIATTIREGVARSVFSNEAGLGISSIAAAAARTDSPGRQAMITMTGALISTVIVCTITGLVLAVTGVLDNATTGGASLAIRAFDTSISGGAYVVMIGLILFAFSTVLAWGYYGEKCFEYLFGEKSILVYRILFCLIVIPGAAIEMEMAWFAADIMNGLMVIPNLIALIGLSKVIKDETAHFLETIKHET